MERIKARKEPVVSSKVSKSDKLNVLKKGLEKNLEQNTKKYAIISPDSILLFAESIGLTDIPEDVCAGLAEDVSYKLREIVNNCCVLIHNNNRLKLLTEDVNHVLRVCDTPPVYGHSVSHELDFVYVPKAEVFVENDNELDIATMSTVITEFTKPGMDYVKGTWLLPDPPEKGESHKDVKEEPSTSKQDARNAPMSLLLSQVSRNASRSDEQLNHLKPPPHFYNYYILLSKSIFGGSELHLREALSDLRSNPKIGSLAPFFLNLMHLSVNKLQRNGKLIDALLRTTEALVDNVHVDPSSQLAVNRAVNALFNIAVDSKVAKSFDDLLLRKRAARLLAKVMVCWNIELKQQRDIVRQLLHLLLDASSTLRSHYGAVTCLTALGHRSLLSYFWPMFDTYIKVLEKHDNTSHDIQFVKGAIMIAVELMYRRGQSNVTGEELKNKMKLEQKLSDFLGDALVPRYNLKTSVGSVYPGTQLVVTADSADQESQPSTDIDLKLRESLFKTCSSQTIFAFKPEVRCIMPKLHMYSVFSLSPRAFKQPKEIIFNFIGSKQLSTSQLQRKKIGYFVQTEYKSHHFKFSQIWQRQKGLKKTRSIRYYCSPSYTKSSVGDLFGFI